ncbi:MAG: PASTA domain-containing protein, partial [Chloroflexota bacterium]|nr:PASTA domain-containing protein [Chloroflexota bacterium]
PGLDRLVERASARDPDNRPRDANELLAEVRRSRQALSPAELDLRPGSASGAAANLTIAHPRTEVVPAVVEPRGARSRTPLFSAGRRRSWAVALLALILVAGAAAGWFFAAGPGATTAVPRVSGSTTIVAEQALTQAHLDTKVVSSFDETIKPGVVIATDPPAGRDLRRGSTVTLTVSQGPERYRVPKVVGRTQAEAEQRLTDARLTVGKVGQAFSETVPQGQVISTTPAEGTSVKRATSVALVTSKGRQPIQLQNWAGKPADQAVKALTGAKLKVDATKQDFSDTVPNGSVISQSPATGTLFQGDPVTLVVSKGPEQVAVPEVIGKQEAEATSILKGLGFQVKIERAFGGFFGTVRLQSIGAGTKATKGTTITLTVV